MRSCPICHRRIRTYSARISCRSHLLLMSNHFIECLTVVLIISHHRIIVYPRIIILSQLDVLNYCRDSETCQQHELEIELLLRLIIFSVSILTFHNSLPYLILSPFEEYMKYCHACIHNFQWIIMLIRSEFQLLSKFYHHCLSRLELIYI